MGFASLGLRTAKQLVHGGGCVSQLGKLFGEFAKPGAKVLVVTDKHMVSLGLIAPALDSLSAAGFGLEVFDEILPDPSEEMIMTATERGRSVGATAVVGFGGGSPMDAAKIVSFLVGKEGKTLDGMWGVHADLPGGRAPLALVPTTAGTGSEVTPVTIVRTKEGPKLGFSSPTLLPDVALLDGALTVTVPPSVTAATGVDAMVHAIEAYTSRIKKNPISDALARDALRLLSGAIHAAVQRGEDDVQARDDMLLGSCMAGRAFAHAPVAAVHALAYPVAVDFHVSHGYSNALMLPEILKYNAAAAAAMYSELAPIVFPSSMAAREKTQETAMLFADKVGELTIELGLEMGLRTVGVTEADIDRMASDAMLQTRLLPNNPREVTEQDARELYFRAL